MNNFCLPLSPNHVCLYLSVGHRPGRFGEEVAGREQVGSNGHPVLLLALCALGWFSPERVAVLPFPAAATGPFWVSIGVTVVWHSLVQCAPP